MKMLWHERLLEDRDWWLVAILPAPIDVGAEIKWHPVHEVERVPF